MTHSVHREEAELVEQCRSGDEGALRVLFERHHKRIYAMALRLTGSIADAEDVVQETFLRAFRKFKAFRGGSAVGTWLVRIAINLSRDMHKRRQKMRTKTDQDGEPVQVDSLRSSAETSDTFARRRLEAALAKLPQGYREVLVMHDVLGMDHAEIAASMGNSLGTSKSQLHKARARMREILKESGR